MTTRSVAIVTGASQGIGRATALRLARDFSVIVLVARNKQSLENTAAEVRSIGAEAIVSALDLRVSRSAKTLVEEILKRFSRIDVLLNIAGAVPQIDLFQMTDAQWDDGMALQGNLGKTWTRSLASCPEGMNGSRSWESERGGNVGTPQLSWCARRRISGCPVGGHFH